MESIVFQSLNYKIYYFRIYQRICQEDSLYIMYNMFNMEDILSVIFLESSGTNVEFDWVQNR